MPTLTDHEHIEDMAQGVEHEFEALLNQLEEQIRQRLTNGEASGDLFHDLKGASISFGLVALARQFAEYEENSQSKEGLVNSWRTDALQLLEQSLEEARSGMNK